MKEHEQLEKRLQHQPLRPVPPAWRDEILSAARGVETSRHASQVARHNYLTALIQQLSTLLWPHPRAWAGLAAVWVVICAMNFTGSNDTASTTARRVTLPSPQMREMLREQEQLLAELVGESPVADRLKSAPPRPHSLYRNEFLNA